MHSTGSIGLMIPYRAKKGTFKFTFSQFERTMDKVTKKMKNLDWRKHEQRSYRENETAH